MTLEEEYAELEIDLGASEAEVRQARNILGIAVLLALAAALAWFSVR